MSFPRFTRVVLLLVVGFAAAPSGWARAYKVLYSFTGEADGASPEAGLALDSAGNLYGTTIGTTYPYDRATGTQLTTGTTAGSVFKLSPGGDFTLLYNFGAGGANGAYPAGGLVRDPAGNLYGATTSGGASPNPCSLGGIGGLGSDPYDGCGTVFKVDANGNFSVLYSFSGNNNCWQGCTPLAPLTLDAAGNLYGATYLGGSQNCGAYPKLNPLAGVLPSDCGVVFKLDTTGKEIVLRHFGNGHTEGDFPNSGLIFDAAGNLYGTAGGGGIYRDGGDSGNDDGGAGAVFELDPSGKETVLYFFNPLVSPVAFPNAGLIQDAAGNFYGTADYVFKLDPQGNLTQLTDYADSPGYSASPLIMDAAGNLYGTTSNGGGGISNPICGSGYGCGTVFRVDPSGNVTVLYNFSGETDGAESQGPVIMDADGNLYGTTAYGGTISDACPVGCGVVFKITP
jgi:uncharacterized repeat protein (TIGR03803 family)